MAERYIRRHVQASYFAHLLPQGYIFAVSPETRVITIIYHHDEIRITREVIEGDNHTSDQETVRVHDFSVMIPVNDFVRLVKDNLRALDEHFPGILEDHEIRI